LNQRNYAPYRFLEDLGQLFKRTADNFNGEEAPNNGFGDTPGNEDEDVVASDVLQGYGIHESVDEAKEAEDNTVRGHTLSTGRRSERAKLEGAPRAARWLLIELRINCILEP
jgi:hypothetical protein